jgi:hypothetical protein
MVRPSGAAKILGQGWSVARVEEMKEKDKDMVGWCRLTLSNPR